MTDDVKRETKLPFAQAVVSPPTMDTCPVCAVKHGKDEPHCRGSVYYQMRFFRAHGRFATAKDAASHCDRQAQTEIIKEYAKRGTVLEIGSEGEDDD